MEIEAEKTGVSGRTVAAVLLVIIIAGAATGGLFYYFRTGSTPSLKLPSSNNDQTSSVSAKPFSLFGSPSYSLEVTGVSVAQSAQVNGYILNVDASYSGSGTWTVNPSDFELVSASSTVYTVLSNIIVGMTAPMSEVDLANGQQAVGQLAFQLPAGQTPSKLEYLDQSANINVSSQGMPQTLSYVCQSPSVYVGASASSVSGSSAQLKYGIYPSSGYYFSGGQITLPIVASLDAFAGTQTNTEVTSITTNSSGVEVTQVQPALPAMLNSGGYLQSTPLNVTISTPSSMCVQEVNLQVTISNAPPSLTP